MENKYNEKEEIASSSSPSDWETPAYARIKKKKSKRLIPYLETELLERDELLFIIKYELFKRNKAAFASFLDLEARNHEVTLLKIKHIRLRERKYGEGEIPSWGQDWYRAYFVNLLLSICIYGNESHT